MQSFPYSTLTQQAEKEETSDYSSQDIISLLDYTNLDENATEEDIKQLCTTANNLTTPVAAICIYPKFIDVVKQHVTQSSTKIATVVNFPNGNQDLDKIINDTQFAIDAGADEIDIVLPYQKYLTNNQSDAIAVIKACKEVCQARAKLKVILETGAMTDDTVIAAASSDCIDAGADFLKTSTGKIVQGATLNAAAVMLSQIKTHNNNHDHTVGFKASGGIRTKQQAIAYLFLAYSILGRNWVTPDTFRFGASSLLNDLMD